MDTVTDYIKRWFEITGFDWDAESWTFTLLDLKYGTTDNNILLKRMIQKYNSEMLAFCVLRNSVSDFLQMKVSLEDIKSGKFDAVLHFANEIEKSSLNGKIEEFRRNLELFMVKPNILGSITDADICKAISSVGPLENLNFDCLVSSEKPFEVQSRISREVVVVSSTAELILKASGMEDGMFLAFVTRAKDAESYFSLVVKSNGNIISVNDHFKELFFGQHGCRRNDRYTENKAYSIFPYQSAIDATYKEDGVHDIIDTAKPKSDNLSFDDFSIEEAIRFYIGCILISYRISGKTVQKKDVVWTTGLATCNIPLLESKALITAQNRELVQSYNSQFKIEIDRDELTFVPFECVKDFLGERNTAATLFREWFTPDMVEDRDNWSSALSDILAHYPNEFMGSLEGIKKAIIQNQRAAIKAKIEKKMDDYLLEHGDGKEAIEFFRTMVEQRKEIVLKNLDSVLRNPKSWIKENAKIEMRSSHDGYVYWQDNWTFYPFNDKNCLKETEKDRCITSYLADEGGLCNMRLDWKALHVDQILNLLSLKESELPKELRGWKNRSNSCRGNSILDLTDPCESISNAITKNSRSHHDARYYHMFEFTIAMSRRQWRKLYGKPE